jgi:ligand-binding SRPBCC domain-containing protein
MKLYRFERCQQVPISRGEAWDFFSDPRNLPLITPPSLGFRITCDLPQRMYPGMIITYSVTPFPLWKVDWVTEITHVDEPRLFIDEQRFGPYAFWHHQHHFRQSNAGTEMCDIVHYALPFGPLGRIAARTVETQLRGIFDFRREYLQREFGTT